MRETRVRALGKDWVIPAEPTVDCILRFRDWIGEQEGDPFDGLESLMNLLPKEEALALVKEARAVKQELKCFSLKTPLAQRYLRTEIGGFKFTELLLRDAYPDMTDREVHAVTLAFAERLAQLAPAGGPEGNDQAPTQPTLALGETT